MPLLNGVDHVRRLRDRYGAERVLPGTIRVEAEQAGPGRVRHLSAFADVQVAPNPATRERAETLCEELRDAGVGCEVQDDETTMLWSKLCFLAPFALATTASEGSLGAVRADAGRWASLEQCVNEACAVGVAEGAMVAPRANPYSTRRDAQRFPKLDAKGRGSGEGTGARCHRGTHPPWR